MFALILGLGDFADKQIKIREITSGRFFENEPSEICSHLRDKGPKGRILCAISSKITLAKEKERRYTQCKNGCQINILLSEFK